MHRSHATKNTTRNSFPLSFTEFQSWYMYFLQWVKFANYISCKECTEMLFKCGRMTRGCGLIKTKGKDRNELGRTIKQGCLHQGRGRFESKCIWQKAQRGGFLQPLSSFPSPSAHWHINIFLPLISSQSVSAPVKFVQLVATSLRVHWLTHRPPSQICANILNLPICANIQNLPICSNTQNLPIRANIQNMPICANIISIWCDTRKYLFSSLFVRQA